MLISGYSFLSLLLSGIIKLIFVVVYLERLDVCQYNKFSLICHLSPNAWCILHILLKVLSPCCQKLS